jgi:heme/copper-type cytochrome/quinol oxidase subunit 2
MPIKTAAVFSAILLSLLALIQAFSTPARAADDKVWEVVATKDQSFVVKGDKKPVIRVTAGQPVHLRITAEKAAEMAKDGSVHSFTIKQLADQGWNIRLKEGTQDYTLTAPSKPGEYVIECAVKCGPGHADQRMKLIVTP